MIQNIIITIIVVVCAWYIGRRLYNNLRKSQPGCGCGCSCSDCGPDLISSCKTNSSDSDKQ